MNLKVIRNEIDLLDSGLCLMLQRRAELAIVAGRLKKTIYQPKREREILRRLLKKQAPLLSDRFIERIYKMIFQHCRELQTLEPCLIGFQGEHGSYSELALRKLNKKSIPLPFRSFNDLLIGLKSGLLDMAVLPIRNSIAGEVPEAIRILHNRHIKVESRVSVRISHCLLATNKTAKITDVFSHPMALSQCSKFLHKHKIKQHEYYDTAGSAKMILGNKLPNTAAIASEECARIYGLKIVRKEIQNTNNNTTEFALLSWR